MQDFNRVHKSKWTAVKKPGERARSTFRVGTEPPDRKSGQTAGRQGVGRCKVQRQHTGQVTGAKTRRRGQGQKAGQVTGDLSGKDNLAESVCGRAA